MKYLALFLTCFLFCSLKSQGQRVIKLENPSFEGRMACCETPKGWCDCGDPKESPPDVQPGSFLVAAEAADGKTYLGLVTRQNNTWEAVGQRLLKSLQHGQTYNLRVYLARSDFYQSLDRITGDEVQYNNPIRLLIWGGHEHCERTELLATSPLIRHFDWKVYNLEFTPKIDNCDFITLEAFYETPFSLAYNGNILVDNLSLRMARKN